MEKSVRISFTHYVPADKNTYQILEDNFISIQNNDKNLFISSSNEDTEGYLYNIMEYYDSLDSFNIFLDDFDKYLKFIEFLRDQNPRKEIRIYYYNEDVDMELYSSTEKKLDCVDLEYLFELVDYIKLIKKPADA